MALYLRDHGCLTKTPTGQNSLNLDNQPTEKNSKIIGVVVGCRQLGLLEKSGYSLDTLVKLHWFSVMENAISSGNLDLCTQIIKIIPDINIPLSANGSLSPTKRTPLSWAIEQHQFKIAQLFYEKLFDVKKNSFLIKGLNETAATQQSHQALIFDYLQSSSTISKYAFSVLLKFAESDQELANNIIEYQAIYIQFIGGIVKNDVDSIKDAMQQLHIFFKKINLPGSQTVLNNWIRDQAHAELGSRTVTQFLAALHPQQAIKCIQPFVTTLRSYCYLVDADTDPSTCPTNIACEAALTHENLDFVIFMLKQDVPGLYFRSREKQKQLLLMALKNNDANQINLLSDRFVLTISDILEFAIKHDERNLGTVTSEPLLTITCLKNYFKAREPYLFRSQIDRQLNEPLCDEDRLTVPAICRAVETNNLVLVQALFDMGAKLNVDQADLRSRDCQPLTLAAEKSNIDMVVLLLQLSKKTGNGCKLELEDKPLLLKLYQSTSKYLPAANILRNFLKGSALHKSVERISVLSAVLTWAGLLTCIFLGLSSVPGIILLVSGAISFITSLIMFSLGKCYINHFDQTNKDVAVTFILIGVTIALFSGLALLLAPSAAFLGIPLAPLTVGFFIATLFFIAARGLVAMDKAIIGEDGDLKLPSKTEAGTPNMEKSLSSIPLVNSPSEQKLTSSTVALTDITTIVN